MIDPMDVPSFWRISKVTSTIAPRPRSPIACPGEGLGTICMMRPPRTQEPLAGLPFTDTMSATLNKGMKFRMFASATLDEVTSFDGSVRSSM